MSFKISSNPKHSGILWFYEKSLPQGGEESPGRGLQRPDHPEADQSWEEQVFV